MNPPAPARKKIALIQSRLRATRAATLEHTEGQVRQAAQEGAQLVCLQELFADPYFCQTEDPAFFELAEPFDGALGKKFSALASELGVVIVVPFFEKRAEGLYHNALSVLGPDGSCLGRYRKMHIPDDPQFMEKYYFAPGDLGFLACDSPVGRLGPLICWDQWYPEAARLVAMKGAQVLIYPTAIGWLPSEKENDGEAQLDAWKTMQRSHAIANGTYVVAVNRVGKEEQKGAEIEFWGHSLVVDPLGRVVAEADEVEQILYAELDFSLLGETRKWWPFFRDRRIDAYQELTQRWLQ